MFDNFGPYPNGSRLSCSQPPCRNIGLGFGLSRYLKCFELTHAGWDCQATECSSPTHVGLLWPACKYVPVNIIVCLCVCAKNLDSR